MKFDFLNNGIVIGVAVALATSVINLFLVPTLEQRVLRRNEIWKDKKQLFTDTLDLLSRRWDSSNFNGLGSENHYITGNAPTTIEKNHILSQLFMLTDNKNIPNEFIQLVEVSTTPQGIAVFRAMLREELDGKKIETPPEEVPIFYTRK